MPPETRRSPHARATHARATPAAPHMRPKRPRRRLARAATCAAAVALALVAAFGGAQLFSNTQDAQATTYEDRSSNFTVPKLYQFSPNWNGSGTSVMKAPGWTYSKTALIGSVQNHCEGYRVTANTAAGKYVTITNVGWFKGKSVDLKITVSSVSECWGNNYIAIQGNFNRYGTAIDCSYCTVKLRYDFYYSGSNFKTAASDLYWYNYTYNITTGTIAGTDETMTINTSGVDKAISNKYITRSGATFKANTKNKGGELLTLHHGSTYTVTLKKGMITETSGSSLKIADQKVTLTGNLYDVTSGSEVEFTSSRVSKQVSMYNSDTSATTVSLAIPTGYELKYSRTDSNTNDATAAASRTWQYANSNHNLKVYVAKKSYKITTTVVNGTIDPSCTALYGTSKTIGYSPKAGYKLKSVTVDGTNVTGSQPSSKTFSNISANHTVSVVYEPITVPFSFTKTNTAGTGLSGAVFVLKQGSTTVKTVTSGSDGKVDLGGLEAGTYTLTESTAPAGYVASGGSWTVTVNAVSSTVSVAAGSGATAFSGSYTAGYKLANAGKTVPFSFTKTNTAGTALSGAVFVLKQGSTTVKTVTSTSAGKVDFGSLGAGTYTLTESSAPAGYVASGGSWTVTVNAVNSTVSVAAASGATAFSGTYGSYKLANAEKKLPFSFTKTDDAGAALAGAVFVLKNGSTTVGTVTSASDGTVDFGDLGAGTYTLTETSAPAGYTAAGGSWTVTVNAVNSTVSIAKGSGATTDFSGTYAAGYKLANALKPLPFSFTKTDADTGDALSGARFGLYSSTEMTASALVKSATSTADGLVDFGDLASGTYYLSETTAPDGYKKISGYWRVDVNLAGANTVAVSRASGTTDFSGSYAAGYKLANEKSGTPFSFTKTDENGAALAGASFKLTKYNDSTFTRTATSAADGKVDFGRLEAGTYTMTETSAPDGYGLPGNCYWEITVTESGGVSVSSGASSKGMEGLPFTGSYATGYKLANYPPLPLSITKFDEDTGAPLAGATFAIEDPHGSVYVSRATTGADGVATFKGFTVPGVYELTEDSAPDGYERVDGIWEVTVDIVARTIAIASDNVDKEFDGDYASGYRLGNTKTDPTTAPFSFTKTGIGGAALSGAVFELTDTDGAVTTVTSTEAGLVDFGSLKEGSYTLNETSAPDDYILPSGYWEVVVGSDGSVEVTPQDGAPNFKGSYEEGWKLANTPVGLPFSLTKVDENGDPLAGATFLLCDPDMNYYVSEVTSGADGLVTFDNFKSSDVYELYEIEAPEGYELPVGFYSWDVTVNMAEGTVEISKAERSDKDTPDFEGSYETGYRVSNKKEEPVPFSFTKTDESGTALAGATFELKQGDTVVKTVTSADGSGSAAAGLADFGSLDAGTYTLTETSAPTGYEASAGSWTVVVDASAQTATITPNDEATEFSGSYTEGYKLANKAIPIISVEKTTYENYPPSGSNVSPGDQLRYAFTITNSGAASAKVTIRDHFPTGAHVAGVTWGPGSAKPTWEDNTVTWTFDVPANTTYTQACAVRATVTSDAPSTIRNVALYEVDWDGTSDPANETNEIVHYVQRTPLSFAKTDSQTGAGLAGASFMLYNQKTGTTVGTATSDADGKVDFGDVASGTYTLTETAAPSGYAASSGTWKLVVDAVAKTVAITPGDNATEFSGSYEDGDLKLPNEPMKGNFSFKKTDADGTGLPNATFQLRQGSTTVGTAKSGQDGVVSFTGLEAGTYDLYEVAAPDRYSLNAFGSDFHWTVTLALAADGKSVDVQTVTSFVPEGSYAQAIDFEGSTASGWTLKNYEPLPFSFKKVDEDGNPIPNVNFTLADSPNSGIAAWSTNENGIITMPTGFTHSGTYKLSESMAPDGYEKWTGQWNVAVDMEARTVSISIDSEYGGTAIDFEGDYQSGFTLVNKKPSIPLTFTKVDENDNPLPGAEFLVECYDVEGYSEGDDFAYATSDENGLVAFDRGFSKPGIYTLSEQVAPATYDRPGSPWKITVVQDAGTKALSIESIEPMGDDAPLFAGNYEDGYTLANERADRMPFSFTKTDVEGAELQGATFELRRDGKVAATVTSDEEGWVDFGKLDAGDWTLVETAAPAGYAEPTGSWTVSVDVEKWEMNIASVDGAPLFGGKFEDGFTLVNELELVDFTFGKADSKTGTFLTGAKFTLTPASGTAIGAESGVDGIVRFEDLANGTYTLAETAAPAGYAALAGTWTVTVDSKAKEPVVVTASDGTRAFSGNYDDGFTVSNDAIAVPFSFTKTDSKTGAALPGAVFTLDRGDGTVLSATADSNGKVDFGLLDKEGYYTLAETSAPEGYYRVLGTWEVNVDIANQTVEMHAKQGTTTYAPEPGGSYADGYSVADDPDEGVVPFSFAKTDEAAEGGLALENAAFTLYTCVEGHTGTADSHSGTPGSDTSCWKLFRSVGGADHTGSTFDFGKLARGTQYMLVETKAPTGYTDAGGTWHAADYELPSGSWLLSVPADATTQKDISVEACEGGVGDADWEFGDAQAFAAGEASKYVVNEAAATAPLKFVKKSSDMKTALPGFTFALYECTNPLHTGMYSHSATATGGTDSCWGSFDGDGAATGDPLVTAVSGADGTVDFGELPRGYYMLVETAAPASYTTASGRVWEFERPTGQVLIDFDTFFGQTADDGSEVFSIPQEQRGDGGLAIETGSDDAAKNVGSTVVNTPTNLTNDDLTADFTFTKVGEGDEVLSGATFELYACGNSAHTGIDDHSELATNDADCCWKVNSAVASATSGADGKVSFTGLLSGHYMMVETVAPDGYRAPYGQWLLDVDAVAGSVSVKARGDQLPPAFKVGEDGAYSLPNYRNWHMPLAGAGGAVLVTVAGAALVTAAVVGLLFSKRKRRCVRTR